MAKNGQETAASLLGMGEPLDEPEPPDENDPAPYLPPNCDLVELTPEHIQRAKARNHDPTVVTLMIGRVQGARVEHLGTFAAAGANLEQLAATFGAGVYEVRYKNPTGAYVGARRIHVGPNGAHVGPPPMPGALSPSSGFPAIGAASSAAMRGGSPLEVIAMRLLEQKMFGQQDDPMRGAMAETLKLMAMGAESQRQAAAAAAEGQRQFLDMVLKLQTFGQPKDDKAFELLKVMLVQQQARPQSSGGGFADFVKVFELAKSFQQSGGPIAITNPSGDDDDDGAGWLKLVEPALDSMGPATVSLLSQMFLPPEKSKFVSEAIEHHMKAREAEAKAAGTVEAEGVAVP